MKPRLAVLDMVGTTVEAGPEVSEAFRNLSTTMGHSSRLIREQFPV